jgi:hypothetical protein
MLLQVALLLEQLNKTVGGVMINSDYLHCCFDRTELDAKLAGAEEVLHRIPFEIIACRGVSGLLFASLLSYRMRKGLVIVRKEDHSTHSCCRVEGHLPINGEKWVIVDDFISSGATIGEIIAKLGKYALPGLLGAYLYKLHDYRPVSRLYRVDRIAHVIDGLTPVESPKPIQTDSGFVYRNLEMEA